MTDNLQPVAVQESDLRLLSYAELGQLLEILTGNVLKVCRERSLRIDAVAPIWRSGAVPGCHLASKLGVVDLLPLQYKHTHDRTHPIHRPYAVPTLTRALNRPVILMADANTVTGEIAQCAAADIRATWPDSTILFASVMLDVLRWTPLLRPHGAIFKLVFSEAAPVLVLCSFPRALIDFRKERATNPQARRPPSPVFGVLFLTAEGGLISSPDSSLSELSVLEPVVG
jgi:hypothetical protein